MNAELYLAFVLASIAIILLPGPSVLLTVAHSLAHGWRPAFATVAGATCGVGVQLAVMLIGMSWLLALMAEAFEWLRWAGVAYLAYLGLQQWRADPDAPAPPARAGKLRTLYLQGLVVTTANPKTLLFFAAFFPQFVDPAQPLGLQLPVMFVSFLVITFVFTGLWALLAGRAAALLRSRRRILLRNRITGTLFIGAGFGLALARRGG